MAQAGGRQGSSFHLYAKAYRGRPSETPDKPLLYVPTHLALILDKDLEAAGLLEHALGGKIDFHACRVVYINLVLESGVRLKEAQTLARHATPELTMNVYGRARDEQLSEAVENVGKRLLSQQEFVPSVHRQTADAERESATPIEIESCAFFRIGGGGGN